MKTQAIAFTWMYAEIINPETGEADRQRVMVPTRRYRGVAARQYGDEGAEWVLEPVTSRDMIKHRAHFAELNELYDNLPERTFYEHDAKGQPVVDEHGEKKLQWKDADIFRYWLLCRTKWSTENRYEMATTQEAIRLARRFRSELGYAEVRIPKIPGNIVVIRQPMSQSLSEMKAGDFEESMKEILDLARSMVEVTATESRRAAGRSA